MAEPIILPKNHCFLHHADDIDQILTPLKRFGISTLTYMRNYSNLSQIFISNNANWTEDYYSSAYFGQFISRPATSYKAGYLIIPPNSPLPVHIHPKERYDTNHAAAFIKPHTNYTDFYFFAGTNSSKYVINLYINNTNIFEKFILYFQDSAEKIIEKAKNHKIILPKPDYPQNHIDEYIINPNDINHALNEMRVRKYKLKTEELKNVTLTGRELDAIFCLIDGMTAKESANALNISQRTVETYFENIKVKLGCYTKNDILKILSKDGFPVE